MDAKYKKTKLLKSLNHGLVGSSDINQIIVACKIEKCLHGVLIFPSNGEHGTYHQTWKISDEGFPKYISNIYLNLEDMYVSGGEYKLSNDLFEELKKIRDYV